MGPVGGHEFRPVKHSVAPYKQVMENWPRDNQSRLELGKLEFADQVFGPESLEFDPLGRGPYTGLADGRIVRWMGKDVGWETFSFVTTNWCVLLPHSQLTFFSKKRKKKERKVLDGQLLKFSYPAMRNVTQQVI